MPNNSAAGRKYKSRTQPPCDSCRKRRICCVRLPGSVNCSLCQTRGTHCMYDSAPAPKRGRPAAAAAAGRRLAAAGAIAVANEARTAARPSPGSITSPGTGGDGRGQPASGFSAVPTATPNSTGRPATLPESTRWGSQFIGLSGDLDPFVLRHCTFDADCYQQLDWACLRVDGGSGVSPAHFAVVPESHLDVRPAYYPTMDVPDAIRSDGCRMLVAFLETVHPCFPLLDALPLRDQWRRSNVLLAAMCALAAPFVRHHDAEMRSNFIRYIFSALMVERRRPALDAVEAGLLYLQRQGVIQRAPTTPALWADLGSVVGMCQDLGLHVDPTCWNIAPAHRNRRIRLWWAAYIWDKFCAFGLGRPAYIRDEDFTVPPLTVEHFDTADNTAPPAARSHFVAMAALATVLARLLQTFYSVTATERLRCGPPVQLRHLFVDLQQQLATFRVQYLDNLLTMPWSATTCAFPDCRGTVTLAFHAVEIALCRAVLRVLPADDPGYRAARRYGGEAVDAVCDLLRTLQVSRLRAYWWHPISTIHFSLVGSFMFFLLLSSTEDADIELWSVKIKEYRRLLQLDDLGFDVTRLAAKRMALLASVNEESLAPTPPGSNLFNDTSTATAAGSVAMGEYFEGGLVVALGDRADERTQALHAVG